MTVAQVEQMGAQEFAEWMVYMELESHRREHASKTQKLGRR